MNLESVCDVFATRPFPRAQEVDHPPVESVLEVRSAIAEALVGDDFLADCISHELQLFRSGRPRNGLTPFRTIPDLGVQFAFGYWPPGAVAVPHEHTAWTVTAVCRNRLEVLTFDHSETYGRRTLVSKNRFHAAMGKVGYIYAPCIHSPKNPTMDWALSLHVYSPLDGKLLVDEADVLPFLDRTLPVDDSVMNHPYSGVIAARQRHAFVHFLCRVAMSMNDPNARRLFRPCYELGSSATRRMLRERGAVASREAGSTSRFTRTNDALTLIVRDDGDTAALCVETADGVVEAFVVSSIARQAVEFAAKEVSFNVDELPGALADEERVAIASMLEESGVFHEVNQ